MKLSLVIAATAAAAAAALFTSACSKTKAEAGAPAAAEIPVVAVAQVKTEDLSRGVTLTAEFIPYQEVDVMSKVAGYVQEIGVDIGDLVQKDQLLATLMVPEMADDLNRASAAVDRAHASVKQAQDELTRAKSAYDIANLNYTRLDAVVKQQPGLVAQQEVDDAHGKALVAQAQVAAADSAVQAANEQVLVNQADMAKIKTLMEYTKVTAPFTGIITKRYADTGSMIQAGIASQSQAEPVVRLSQINLLRLILPVPESDVPTIHIGQRVEVHVPSLNRSFPGEVKRFKKRLSLATRTMDTEVDVPNPERVLMPGMYAEVNLTLAHRNRVLTAPVNAVAAGGEIAVVTPNHRVEMRKISIGIETASQVEVLSGLNEGDMVIIGNRSGLQPGQEVQPKITEMAAIKQ